MKSKSFLLICVILCGAIYSNAQWWEPVDPWEVGYIYSEDGGHIVGCNISGYEDKVDNLTIPKEITVKKEEDDDVFVTMTVPVKEVGGHFKCTTLTIDADLDYLSTTVEVENLNINGRVSLISGNNGSSIKNLTIDGKVDRIFQAFNGSTIQNVSLFDVDEIDESFGGDDFFGLSSIQYLTLGHIKKMTRSFSTPIDIKYLSHIDELDRCFNWIETPNDITLPDNLRKLSNISIGDFYDNGELNITCNQDLESISFSTHKRTDLTLYAGTDFPEISAGQGSRFYYIGTKAQFDEAITETVFYMGGVVSRNENRFRRNITVYTDSYMSAEGKMAGTLWTTLKWPLKERIIPNGFLGNYPHIESVEIPEIDYVGISAFQSCDNLSNISVNAKEIGREAFAWEGIQLYPHYTHEIEKVSIGSNVKCIHGSAFFNATVKDLQINMPLKQWFKINRKFILNPATYLEVICIAFSHTLKTTVNGKVIQDIFEVPGDVTNIPPYAIPGNKIASIIIPATVDSISEYAFCNSGKLTSIKFIPGTARSVKKLHIGANAFNNCENLSEISFENIPYSIGEHAFHNTPWYENQPDGVIQIGSIYYDYKSHGTVNDGRLSIPEGITCISSFGDDYEYNSVRELILPSTLEVVPKMYKFRGVDAIYAKMHNPTDYTEDVLYYQCDKALLPKKFYNGEGTIYVASEDLEKYKSTKGWNGFWSLNNDEYRLDSQPTNIVAYLFDGIENVEKEETPFAIKGSIINFNQLSEVFDISGRLVYRGANQITLSKGIYLIKYSNEVRKVTIN